MGWVLMWSDCAGCFVRRVTVWVHMFVLGVRVGVGLLQTYVPQQR